MTIAEIYEAVRRSRADTLVAYAFRRALGLPQPNRRGSVATRIDKYADARQLMAQRYGVRM